MRFRIVLLFALTFLSLSESAFASMYTSNELSKFMRKSSSCSLAVGFLSPGPEFKSGEPNLGNTVFCVGDFRVNVGTIKEAGGCAFVLYDVDSNSLKSPYVYRENPETLHKSGFPMVENSACDKGGFEKLLKLYPGLTNGTTVAEALANGPVYAQGVYLLHTSNVKYSSWWKKNVKKKGPQKIAAEKKMIVNCENFQVTMQDKFECLPEQDLLKEYCEYKTMGERNKDQFNLDISIQINKVFERRFSNKPTCSSPETKDQSDTNTSNPEKK